VPITRQKNTNIFQLLHCQQTRSLLITLYNKEPMGKQPGFLHPIPKFDIPMHTKHIDHLGPFVMSARKNTHLMLAIDGFTKFGFLKTVRNTSVGLVLGSLDEIFNMFGVAPRIVCDRGSCFTSKHFVNSIRAKFHLYHCTLVQYPKRTDFPKRVEFCPFIEENIHEDNNFLDKILFSDEARFSNKGAVNRHNCHYYL
jgi:hypothetical protein